MIYRGGVPFKTKLAPNFRLSPGVEAARRVGSFSGGGSRFAGGAPYFFKSGKGEQTRAEGPAL